MNSGNSRSSTEDAKAIEGLSIDEPFDGESTGVRPRVVKRLPLVHDMLCEEVSVQAELPSDEFVLPSWEELTGLRARVKRGEPLADRDVSSGRQQAIDLVEAEQRRRSTAPPAHEQAGNSAVVSGVSRGGGRAIVEPVASLPWVDRFRRDTNARLEAPEVEQMDELAELQERFAPSARPLLSLAVPPPPMSRVRSELQAPPSSRPIFRPHVPSSFPANRPLPRFALGPRMDGLLGSEHRPHGVVPPSLAPVAANDVRPRERMNPWVAGLLGAVMTAAAGFAFFWSPQNESKSTASLAASAIEEESRGAESHPFSQNAAQQLANGAAEKARACGIGKVPTEIGVTFDSDGTVRSVDARGEKRLSEDTASCMDESFSNLRIPPFDGEAREIHLNLR